VTKPHLKKVEVSVTPGLPICLDLLLQLSFANVRDIKKSVTVIVGTGRNPDPVVMISSVLWIRISGG
jgi:hypothetical protein